MLRVMSRFFLHHFREKGTTCAATRSASWMRTTHCIMTTMTHENGERQRRKSGNGASHVFPRFTFQNQAGFLLTFSLSFSIPIARSVCMCVSLSLSVSLTILERARCVISIFYKHFLLSCRSTDTCLCVCTSTTMIVR